MVRIAAAIIIFVSLFVLGDHAAMSKRQSNPTRLRKFLEATTLKSGANPPADEIAYVYYS